MSGRKGIYVERGCPTRICAHTPRPDSEVAQQKVDLYVGPAKCEAAQAVHTLARPATKDMMNACMITNLGSGEFVCQSGHL